MAKECLETEMRVDAVLSAKNKNVQEGHRKD